MCDTRHVERTLQNCDSDSEVWFECQICEHVFVRSVDDLGAQSSESYLASLRFRESDDRELLRSLQTDFPLAG